MVSIKARVCDEITLDPKVYYRAPSLKLEQLERLRSEIPLPPMITSV